MNSETPAPRVSKQIDENLRRVYEEAMEENVPDRFKELLERLKEQEKSDDQDKPER